MGVWELLAEADDEDDEPAEKPKHVNPLLKPTAGPQAGERPTSMTPSALGAGSGAIAAKQKQTTDVHPAAVSKVPSRASTLAKMGISQKNYYDDDHPASAVQRGLRSGGQKPKPEPVVAQKPGYKGSVPGQTYTRTGTSQRKPVSWTDKATGDRKFGSVQGKPGQTDELVWDGEDWVTRQEYMRKVWARKMGRNESMGRSVWEMLHEAMTPVRASADAKKKPPGYLPGVHDPNSPARPGKRRPTPPSGIQPVKTEEPDEATNWGKVNKAANMRRWGTQDRRADNTIAANRLQKSLDQKRAARAAASGAPAPAPAVAAPRPKAELPPKPKTSFASDDKPDMSNPLMRPSPLDPDKKRELESVLNLSAASLMECGCVWSEALAEAESEPDEKEKDKKDEPEKKSPPKKKKESPPKDAAPMPAATVGGAGLPSDVADKIRDAIESLESLVPDVDPDGDMPADDDMMDLDAPIDDLAEIDY